LEPKIFADGLFKGKSAIVTGGGTGIGAVIAQTFGELGADVLIASRTEENLRKAREELLAHTDARVEYTVTDIRDYESVKQMYATAEDLFGKIDIVVNNAGGQFMCRFEDMSVNGFRAVTELNLMGTFHSCKLACEHMRRRGGGKIVNIVNDYCFERGSPETAHSGASRAGVVNLTFTLALEMAPYGITANVVSPGVTETAAIGFYYGDYGDWLERARDAIPVRRFARASEVANLVAYLASPAADFITGIAVRIDGGSFIGNIEYAWPEAMKYGTDPDGQRPDRYHPRPLLARKS
jgi:NAD(P)-dependent dehydrogenase (short-subunit alcohol dehydrogenase family)